MDYDRDKMRGVAEKIQVGDADEGAEALQELIDTAVEQANARQANDRGSLREAMREEMAEARIRHENTRALESFGKKYKKVADDPVLAEAAAHVIRDKIVDDLKSIGIPDDVIAPLRGDTNSLVTAHTQARMKGHRMSSPEQLLDATGAELGRRFNIKPAQRSPAEYVRSLREERGFSTREQPSQPAGASDYGRGAGRSDEETMARNQEWIRKAREARGYDRRSDR